MTKTTEFIPYTGPKQTDGTSTLAGLEREPEEDRPGYLTYWFRFDGVDRPVTSGFALHKKHAGRFERAFQAGVVVTKIKTATDVNGQTYTDFHNEVFFRYANSDLARLGF